MITLNVNGEPREYTGDGDMPLLWYLRDLLGLTGTKYSCGKGLCGACTVHLNGAAVRSCVITMAAAAIEPSRPHSARSAPMTATASRSADHTTEMAPSPLPASGSTAAAMMTGSRPMSMRAALSWQSCRP